MFDTNLDDLTSVTKVNLEQALCLFMAEVTKVSGEEYLGKTLYQLAVSIEHYLNEKGLKGKLVDGPNFEWFRIMLDNVMKERALANIGMVKKQAELIPMNFENELWECGILGEDNGDKLHNTILFLLGINCSLKGLVMSTMTCDVTHQTSLRN